MPDSIFTLAASSAPQLISGAAVTFKIAALAIAFSTLGGFLYGVLSQSGKRWVAAGMRAYLSAFRVVPLLVWLYLFFFAMPLLVNVDISNVWCAIIVLSMWGSTEVGEVVRGGLKSVSKGQHDAALAIGLKGTQVYTEVLLPQALPIVLAPMINVYTRIIKATSLAALIGVAEVLKMGQQIIERTFESVLIYTLIAMFFFFICYPLSIFARHLESRQEYR